MPVFAAKGTRDFLPAAMYGRLRVIQTIRDVYATFGFEPLETPAMERVAHKRGASASFTSATGTSSEPNPSSLTPSASRWRTSRSKSLVLTTS